MLVCNVSFKQISNRYYLVPEGVTIAHDDFVVVETARGLEVGKAVGASEYQELDNLEEMESIIRVASEIDILMMEANQMEENKIVAKTKEFVRRRDLNMKVLASEYTLNKERLIIYFESEQRVDFRELVKDLSEEYRTRIELKQIGSRDGAKLIGSIGPCGYVTCCESFIGNFENISIKMAKNQNLSLNPQKISGNCGKLLCCIKYENEMYEELRENLPDLDEYVLTKNGKGKVVDIQILKQRVKVVFKEGNVASFPVNEVKRVA
ncbi:MAG: regulatory iron-sulfur-containing complex subunit RicT [Acholeplasmatales bacterium]|jgi:cell fate regulator YaaT (PSP1 superfamily)|nr:regulatory iron-sulfur-containing complex subunit RicT [Acholeplasmataceae bacterium]MDY0115365.1 regulatory iron-sulfur-containing complex subunit RicT [Acholeplasmatales bacterium]HHT39164.1 stage 0 sporulation protein [Acholeplasmataceae bacterium]